MPSFKESNFAGVMATNLAATRVSTTRGSDTAQYAGLGACAWLS
jgi:hypothetical protein